MTELDVLLEDFNNELKEIKDKYEFMINKKSSELNLPEEKYINLINKMGDDFYQISTELIKNVYKKNIAEQKLLESEEKYYQIIENLYDVILVLNENFRVEYVNELPLFRIAGWHRNDLIGQEYIKFIHADDLKKALNEFSKFFKTGKTTIEIRLKHKNGLYVWTEAKGMIFKDEDEKQKALITVRDISKRKIAEKNLKKSEERLRLLNNELRQRVEKRNEKLKESEEKYRLITENANDLMVIINENIEIEWINEQVHERLRGFSHKDRIGKPALNFIHPDDLDIAIKTFKKGFKAGEGMGVVRMRNKIGGYSWLNVRGKTFIDKDGKKKALLISRDITEQKKAEQELKESEEKFKNIFKSIPMGMHLYELDSKGKLVFLGANPAADKILGVDCHQFINKTIEEAFPPLIKTDIPDRYRKLAKEEGFSKWDQIDYEHGQINGAFEVTAFHTSPMKMVTFFTDITERIKAEQKLKESEEKFRKLFQLNPDVTYITDLKGNFIDGNFTLLNLHGISIEELRKRNAFDYNIGDRKDLLTVVEQLRAGEVINGFEVKSKVKGKEIRDFEVNAIPLKEKGKITKILSVARDITKRKIAEQQLKESEGKYKALFEESPYSIVLLDLDGNFVDCNPARLKIFGSTKKELIGKNFKELSLFPPKYQQIANEAFRLLFKEKFVEPIIVQSYNKDGNLIWIQIQGKIIKVGEKALVQVITQDIHERKKAEQKLKESEERFRTLFEVAPASIMVADLESNILMCNEKFCKLHGFENPEIVKGRKFSEFISKKDRLKLSEGVKETLEGNNRDIISYTMLKNDGTEFPAEAMSSAIKDKDGNIIGIIGVAQDITKRKKAEQIVKESEEKFRTIAEQSFMGIIILQDEKLKYVNEAGAKIFDYSVEEVMNWSKNYMVEKCIHPEDLPILREKRELRRRGEFNLKPYISYRVITKSGNIKWIDQFSRIIVYQGKEAELISIIDITDQKEAEKIITEENKKLLELDQMRKELLTRVSHELKTPLVSIFSCSELLIDYYKEQMSEEVMKFVEIIHRGGKRLKDLIKNLLDASQIDAGKLKLNKEKANLIEIIRNCINYVKFLVDDRKITLDYEFPEELFIEVDKIRIEQVFTNLLSNALKNTPTNGNICLNITEEDNHIYTTIKDTGVGFTKKEMDKIFKKFGKIERYGKELDVDIEGSGLGLYISKEIVNLHEGMIWVESEGRNKGATFTIKLPASK